MMQMIEVPSSPPSALSSLFASLHDSTSIEERTNASLTHVVDSVMGSMHEASQRSKPSLQGLLSGLPQADRRQTTTWIVEAYQVMGFSDAAIFQTTLVLDRYYACRAPGVISAVVAQQKLLAATCLSLKLGTRDETQLPLRQVVAHLGRDRVRFSDVVKAEMRMLSKLMFCVGTPTAHDFLETLSMRLVRQVPLSASLAQYLLQLTLIDPVMHYAYPHAVLGAAALALALTALKAPAAAFSRLLEDLALHCPETEVVAGQLAACCQDMHQLWVQSQTSSCSFAELLRSKFARAGYHAVSNIAPPPLPPSVLPPMQVSAPRALNARIGGA